MFVRLPTGAVLIEILLVFRRAQSGQCLSDARTRETVALALKISGLALLTAVTAGRKSHTALRLYRNGEVSEPAVVKHHAHRCAGQMLPRLMIRIVIRTGDKLE
jgi:hypothetical protein